MACILIVDDEPSILKALQRLLIDEESTQVITAVSAIEALALLQNRQGNVDLVISDERMPGLSGSDFLAQVRDLYPNTVRIILTGYADQTATIKAINDASVYRYISKPWDDQLILQTIREAIQLKLLKDRNEDLSRRVLGQKNELQRLNESLEQQIQTRTEQLKKSLETLKVRNAQLSNQKQGAISLLNAVLGTYDASKARIATAVTEQWKIVGAKGGLSLSEEGLLAAEISAWILGADDSYLHFLSMIDGFGDVISILELVSENYDGSGPRRQAGVQIPVESRLLRIIYDYCSISPGQEDLSRQHVLSRANATYDPALTKLVFGLLPPTFSDQKFAVGLEHLRDGMQTAAELKLTNGAILLASGTILNQKIIAQLRRLEPYLASNKLVVNTSTIEEGVR